MRSLLLDTDVLIEILRGNNASVLSKWKDLGDGDALALYSPVTAAELWQGLRNGEMPHVQVLLENMTCVPIEEEIGRAAGRYLRRFRASHGLALGDALIAGTANVHSVPLWTRNRKHFPMADIQLF